MPIAGKDLEGIPYPSQHALDEDKQYFLKKMNWTEKLFDEYLKRPRIEHDSYPSERKLYEKLAAFRIRLISKRNDNDVNK